MKLFIITTFLAAIITCNCLAQDKSSASSEVIKEVNINGNAIIRIDNYKRNLEVKSWKEDKIKIVVSGINAPGNANTDDLLDKSGITIRQSGNNFTISIKESSNNILWNSTSTTNHFNSLTTIEDAANIVDSPSNEGSHKIAQYLATSSKQAVTLYIPQSGKIRMDSKYGNLSFINTIDNLDLDIIHGNVDAQNIGNLKLISKYGNFTCGDIKIGEVDFINGRLTTNNADDLELDTKYSNVEMALVKKLSFISTNDEYVIEEAGEINGRKNYGSFRISQLNHSLELDGTNADIKVRNISPSLKLIRLDDKYADLRLPLKNVKNYAFDVTGTYNTVYSAKDFGGTKDDSGRDNARVQGTAGNGNDAKVFIKCQNCTIDLK